MESQLAEYRARKERERNAQGSWFSKFLRNRSQSSATSTETSLAAHPAAGTDHQAQTADVRSVRRVPQQTQPFPLLQTEEPEGSLFSSADWKTYVPLLLKVLLWILLWKYFISIGFGAVYFIVSCSYLMYRNTGTIPRARNVLSAYSVFNPNQERLDGTFTSEQFERELRLGSGSVR